MPPEQPEKESISPIRHRRLRSLNSTPSSGPIDLTGTMEPETSRSRKHDRKDNASQPERPSKRPKLKHDSEPPICKNTIMSPKAKPKRLQKKINHRKASRTRKEHELKERNKPQKHDSKNARQAHKGTIKKLKGTKQDLEHRNKDHEWNTAELESDRKTCEEKSEEVRHPTIETDQKKLRSLKESCQENDEGLKDKDAIIAAMQKKLDEAEKNLTKVSHDLEAALTVIDQNGYRNEQIAQRERKAKETLKKERQEHNTKDSTLRTENQELYRQRADLEKSLRKQETESNKMITGLEQQLEEAFTESQRFNFKVSDEKVKQDFTNLESKIRQFVDKYTRPVLHSTEKDLQIVWTNWSPELHRFLASPLMCNLAFEGYIWERLLARMFTPWSKVWDGELGRSLEKTLSIAAEETEHAGFENELYIDYQHWRSNSSTFIGRLNGDDFPTKNFGSDVEAMVSNLARLCGHEVNDTMHAGVMEIFSKARDFELQLRKLKAAYSFHMCKPVLTDGKSSYGMPFDDNSMVDRSPSPAVKNHKEPLPVDFVMSPGLHKRGRNDGDGYGDEIWLVKMGVVCNTAKLLPELGSSSTAQPISVQTQEVLHSIEVKQEVEDHGPVLQCHTGSEASESKTETPVSGPTHITTFEDPELLHSPYPLSAPKLTSGPPATNLHDYDLEPSIPKDLGTDSNVHN